MKSVLYLIQAKAELPTIYACLRKRNFLLLSYKTQTSDTTIFAPNTTWAGGRNMLYEYVKKHALMYDYYVFMDEDAILLPTSQLKKYPLVHLFYSMLKSLFELSVTRSLCIQLFSKVQESGYESLEASFELNYSVVTPMFRGYFKNKTRSLHGPVEIPEEFHQGPICKTWAVQTITVFDSTIAALSKDAFFAETILPYTTTYDNYSWYLSPAIFYFKANHYYPNQLIRNNCYFVFNTQNSNYPRGVVTKQLAIEVYRSVCKELAVHEIRGSTIKKIPTYTLRHRLQSRNHALFQNIQYMLFIFLFPIFFGVAIILRFTRND